MATLSTLSAAGGPLTHVSIPLSAGDQPLRSVYGLPGFMSDLQNTLPGWRQGRLRASQSPQEQMDDILYRWISGKEIKYEKMFKDLMPQEDEVWQFKTADLRIFGWMYKPCVFIAAKLDYADWYKHPTQRKNYTTACMFVVSERNRLNLDEPKYATGTFDELVRVQRN